MSAIDTASRVIQWAMASAAGSGGPPPQGDVRAPEQLSHPPSQLCDSLASLLETSAARFHLDNPPFGDNAPLGVSTLVIAAAIGMAAIPGAAVYLLNAVSAPTTPKEWIARHAVVAPALRFLPEILTDYFRLVSPLTALLDYPAKGQQGQALEVENRLLMQPAGRLFLTLQFAQPTQDINVRQWRQNQLERLRLAEEAFVVDVYEAIMIHHRDEALAQVKQAYSVIIDPVAASKEQLLREALSIAEWWGPLWAIERANVDVLRARRYLDYTYREGIALYSLARKMRGLG